MSYVLYVLCLIDKQMQKHTHKVTIIKANDYVNIGQHSTIYYVAGINICREAGVIAKNM